MNNLISRFKYHDPLAFESMTKIISEINNYDNHYRSEIDVDPEALRKEVAKLPYTQGNQNVRKYFELCLVYLKSLLLTYAYDENNETQNIVSEKLF